MYIILDPNKCFNFNGHVCIGVYVLTTKMKTEKWELVHFQVSI